MLDDLLGVGGWDPPAHWGEFLITFPNASSWSLPHTGWHQDWTFATPCEPVRFFKAFMYLNDVATGGGGTLVVRGSHRLAGRFGTGRALDEAGEPVKGSELLYQECSWLRDLASPGHERTRYRRFVEEVTDLDGVGLQVVELTGEPGDIVIIHPWLIHAIAPNAAASPRFVRAPVFGRATPA